MRPEAGWYPDPADDAQLRWWDGSSWTERRTSAEGSHPFHPPAEPAPRARSVVDLTKEPTDLTKEPAEPRSDAAPEPVAPADAWAPEPSWGAEPVPVPRGHAAGPSAVPEREPVGYASAPMAPSGQPLANQGLRLLARVVDYGLFFAAQWVVTTPWRGPYLEAFDRYQASVLAGRPDMLAFVGDPGYARFLMASLVAFVLLTGLYEIVMIKWRGATVGKMVCGIAVVSSAGSPLTWGQSIGRWAAVWPLGQITCWVFTLVDGAWCLWDPDRDCLHDKMSDTRVITSRR